MAWSPDPLCFVHEMCSVSGDAKYRKHVFAMADFLEKEMKALGIDVRKVDLGKQILDGEELQLPPALLGSFGNDPKKKTVQLYAHYDVQPVSGRLSCFCVNHTITDSASIAIRHYYLTVSSFSN